MMEDWYYGVKLGVLVVLGPLEGAKCLYFRLHRTAWFRCLFRDSGARSCGLPVRVRIELEGSAPADPAERAKWEGGEFDSLLLAGWRAAAKSQPTAAVQPGELQALEFDWGGATGAAGAAGAAGAVGLRVAVVVEVPSLWAVRWLRRTVVGNPEALLKGHKVVSVRVLTAEEEVRATVAAERAVEVAALEARALLAEDRVTAAKAMEKAATDAQAADTDLVAATKMVEEAKEAAIKAKKAAEQAKERATALAEADSKAVGDSGGGAEAEEGGAVEAAKAVARLIDGLYEPAAEDLHARFGERGWTMLRHLQARPRTLAHCPHRPPACSQL